MSTSHIKALREQLLHAMRGDQSHMDFDSAVSEFPAHLAGVKPANAPHSAWQLLEHMRIAQNDILEFSRNPKHKSPNWPDEYWPKADAPPSAKAWQSSIESFKKDAAALEDLMSDPQSDLYQPIPGSDGQTLLREALVVAAHNSYHLGQLVFLKKLLQS